MEAEIAKKARRNKNETTKHDSGDLVDEKHYDKLKRLIKLQNISTYQKTSYTED